MSRPKKQMTNAEALPYAEKLADCVLFSWSEELGSNMGQLFRTTPEAVMLSLKLLGIEAGPKDLATLQELASAIESRDRKRVVSWFMQYAPSWPKNGANTLVAQVPSYPSIVRELVAKGVQNIKLKSGPASKLSPYEYPSLAELGDRLSPLVLLLLKEDAGSGRTLQQMIEYQNNDFPTESAFLLKHLDRLESILKDKALLKRAKKLPTRARLIADAIAGAEYDFEPRTSLERTRQGRRMARKKLS